MLPDARVLPASMASTQAGGGVGGFCMPHLACLQFLPLACLPACYALHTLRPGSHRLLRIVRAVAATWVAAEMLYAVGAAGWSRGREMVPAPARRAFDVAFNVALVAAVASPLLS